MAADIGVACAGCRPPATQERWLQLKTAAEERQLWEERGKRRHPVHPRRLRAGGVPKMQIWAAPGLGVGTSPGPLRGTKFSPAPEARSANGVSFQRAPAPDTGASGRPAPASPEREAPSRTPNICAGGAATPAVLRTLLEVFAAARPTAHRAPHPLITARHTRAEQRLPRRRVVSRRHLVRRTPVREKRAAPGIRTCAPHFPPPPAPPMLCAPSGGGAAPFATVHAPSRR